MSLPIRYERVTNTICRSGRPSAADYTDLYNLGIRSIVNLEGDDQASLELSSIGSLPIVQHWFPISFSQIYMSGVPLPLFKRLIDTIVDTLPTSVLIHCEHGQDRTGAVIAAMRMRGGWNYDNAMQEAVEHGYRKAINRGLDSLLEKFAVEYNRL